MACLPDRSAEQSAPALMYTLIQTAKLNDIDPQAWLANVLARMADTPQTKLADLSMELGSPNPSAKSRVAAAYAGGLRSIMAGGEPIGRPEARCSTSRNARRRIRRQQAAVEFDHDRLAGSG